MQFATLNSLEKKLGRCMIRDRFKLRKKLKGLRTIERRSTAGQSSQRKFLPAVKRVESEIDRSIAKVDERKRLLPKLKFPANLPITERLEEIGEAIRRNQVVILAGETGSGKTTQIPKICLGLGRGVAGKIGHTQPRRVAARTVANRVAEELGVKLGQEVGYQVRFTDQVSDKTLIKIMTDGILLAETQHDRYLEEYDTLIIDEAHERSLNIDFLLGYLHRVLARRKDLKLIITSATIDVNRFSQSFNDAPIIEVSGRTYPVDLLYRPLTSIGSMEASRDSEELIQQGIVDALKEIRSLQRSNKSSAQSDVLVFLSGEREIREVAQLLRKAQFKDTEILPLYARLSVVEQKRVFQPHRVQRIILATNVAETSLTIPGIRYVIDPGFARISRYSFRSKVQRLHIEPISRASADQRKGRCGRLSDGVCIRLYSEEDFMSRPEFTDPEVLRTNLGSVILQMLTLNLGEIEQFPFIEKPDARRVNDGFHLLTELQAVDGRKRITRLGRNVAKLPIDLRLARMLLAADIERSLKEVLVIASALAIQDPRERPHDHQQAADEKHRLFQDDNSDFVALLNLWNFYEEKRQQLTQRKLRIVCRENFISFLRMREWRDIHRQLHLMCREMKLEVNRDDADYAAIHRALLTGILGNLGERHSDNEYLGARNRKFFIFPGSSQFKRRPRWLVAAELVETTRLYARQVARIESEWIESLAEHLVTRSYSEPHWEKRAGQVIAYEQVALYGVPIIKRRKVDYAPIDPVLAREIFIQSALVEKQLNSKAGFYHHNNNLIEEIDSLEIKTRRRDILVDPRALYQFYDESIPADIHDAVSLDKWMLARDKDDLLYLTREQLMRREALISDDQYPDRLQWQSISLNLDYHFDPQHEDDGVSVNVPVSILNQVPKNRIEWLIPGMLREKCIALIKSLPKSIRKNFAPADQFVDQALPHMTYDGRPLREVLGDRLMSITGVRIPMDAWQAERLVNYLRMNIRVLDDQGKPIGSGRDIAELVERFTADSQLSFQARPKHPVERKDVIRWDFGELPEIVEFESAGVTVPGYPAIIDQETSVAIEIVDELGMANQITEGGILRLVMLELGQQVKYVSRNIPGFNRFSLYYSTLGSGEELLQEMVAAIFRFTFVENQTLPRNREEFEQCLQRRKNLVTVTNDLGRIIGTALTAQNELQTALGDFGSDAYNTVVKEIKSHLNSLIYRGFLREISYSWLKHIPRYIQADKARLAKLQGSWQRDQQHSRQIGDYWHRYQRRKEELAGKKDRNLEIYRWMIEEYRVSLFAQSLGTSIPVSANRLEKQWLKVTG